jgi:hypothetical protein
MSRPSRSSRTSRLMETMEHRQHPRFPVQFRSSFSSANIVSGEGNVGDLSIRGCRVFSMIEVKVGTALQLRIEVSDEEPPITVRQAVVRWTRGGAFGLEFMTLTPDEWARLQHVVKELELEPYQRNAREEVA